MGTSLRGSVTLVCLCALLGGCGQQEDAVATVVQAGRVDNGLSSNGIAWNGLAWNGIGWNGIAWNGLGWNGIAWNGIAWNGIAWNGIAWNGLHAWVNESDANGDQRIDAADKDLRVRALAYWVSCACGPNDHIPYDDTLDGSKYVLHGALGLAPTWCGGDDTASVPEDEMKLVSACMMARVNMKGNSVPLSVRGLPSSLRATPNEIIAMRQRGGLFFGNLWGTGRYACLTVNSGDPAEAYVGTLELQTPSTFMAMLGRTCDLDDCGGHLVHVGACSLVAFGGLSSTANGYQARETATYASETYPYLFVVIPARVELEGFTVTPCTDITSAKPCTTRNTLVRGSIPLSQIGTCLALGDCTEGLYSDKIAAFGTNGRKLLGLSETQTIEAEINNAGVETYVAPDYAEPFTLAIRYSNGRAVNAPLSVAVSGTGPGSTTFTEINGGAGAFAPTGSWNTYATAYFPGVYLQNVNGYARVRVQLTGTTASAADAPQLDTLYMFPGEPPSSPMQVLIAGAGGPDAGPGPGPTPDAGVSDLDSEPSGCGCRVGERPSRTGPGLGGVLLLVLFAAVIIRALGPRRRRRGSVTLVCLGALLGGCGQHEDGVATVVQAARVDNGLSSNGIAWNGIAWNGIGWNGIAWNGLGWNGIAWNGIAWNGIAWNGIAWNGLHAWVNESDANGDQTIDAADKDLRVRALAYWVSCACGPNDHIPYDDTLDGSKYVLHGALGLGPTWCGGDDTASVPENEMQLVSACMMARVNMKGNSVPLSIRGLPSSLRATPNEIIAMRQRGGTFFGNLWGTGRYACMTFTSADPADAWVGARELLSPWTFMAMLGRTCDLDNCGGHLVHAGYCGNVSFGGLSSTANGYQALETATYASETYPYLFVVIPARVELEAMYATPCTDATSGKPCTTRNTLVRGSIPLSQIATCLARADCTEWQYSDGGGGGTITGKKLLGLDDTQTIEAEINNSGVETYVTPDYAEPFTLAIRYSNGRAVNAPLSVAVSGTLAGSTTFTEINGGAGAFAPTGSWDVYATAYFPGVYLQDVSGYARVRVQLTGTTASTADAPHLDTLYMFPGQPPSSPMQVLIAGAGGPDAGPWPGPGPTPDAGVSDLDGEPSGCGCRVGARPSGAGPALGGVLLLVAAGIIRARCRGRTRRRP